VTDTRHPERVKLGDELPTACDLLDAAPLVLMFADGNLTMRWANAAWYRALDEAHVPQTLRAQLLGASLTEQLVEEDRDMCARVHADHIARSGASCPGEPSVLALRVAWSPSAVAAHAMATTVAGKDGLPIGVLYSFCPWGEKRSYPGGEQVRRSTDIAAIRRLVSTLSHEVNNPLFIVSATLEDLIGDVSDPRVAARLQVAMDAAWRVIEKVKEVLDVSRVGEWSSGGDSSQ
jgi:hypothetical protein